MKTGIVSNTGPVLALSGAGCLELLKNLYDRILVPEAVDSELRKGGQSKLGLYGYLNADWIEVVPQEVIDPLLLTQLDEGEASVITLALKENISSVLIDERKARKIARMVYKLNVSGTVRILIESKKAGLIHSVKDILNTMRLNGYWIHDNIVEYAVRIADEKW